LKASPIALKYLKTQLASSSCDCSLLLYLQQVAASSKSFTKNLHGININHFICLKDSSLCYTEKESLKD